MHLVLTLMSSLTAVRTFSSSLFEPAAKPGLLKKIFAQCNNSVVYILVGAAIISAIFKDWADLGLIIAVVVLNVLIGVVQEGKAESAAEALQSMMAAKSMVVRNNQQRSITAEEIVVGDILYVQAVRVLDIVRLTFFPLIYLSANLSLTRTTASASFAG